jgi:poly(3-hydroxybutyrate) depolymerase
MKRTITATAALGLSCGAFFLACDKDAPESDAPIAMMALRSGDASCPCDCTTTTGEDTTSTTGDDTTSTTTTSGEEPGTGSSSEQISAAFGGMSEPIFQGDAVQGEMVTFPFGGFDERRFRIRYPQGWDPANPTPVIPVFHFHPCGASGANSTYYDSFHWQNNGGFMVITLEAQTLPCWDITDASPDIPYVQHVIETFESLAFVDGSRRLLGGMSSGNFMAETMACRIGADELVVGAGGISWPPDGISAPDPASCVGPVNVMRHHGANDNIVPVARGRESRDFWAAVNGCTNPVTLPASQEPGGWCGIATAPCSCTGYTCAEGSLVYCEDGGAHQWWPQHKTYGTEVFSPME